MLTVPSGPAIHTVRPPERYISRWKVGVPILWCAESVVCAVVAAPSRLRYQKHISLNVIKVKAEEDRG